MATAGMLDADLVRALEAVGPSDTTGTDTLERYLYQFKVAVLRWLGTLAFDVECRILCEFVDDITLVAGREITFCQVKTRDRGAWTASIVLQSGGGLNSLVRSYNHAKAAGLCDAVRLELILEGPESSSQDTRNFFANPANATENQRRKLRDLGLQAGDTADFLGRLTITPQYHARQSIDGVIALTLMGITPGDSSTIADTYKELFERVARAHLGLADQAKGDFPLVLQPATESEEPSAAKRHSLSRSELLQLLPPVPALASEQRELLEAANGGPLRMTTLEFKLRVAGADDKTVNRAKSRRAEASITLASRAALTDETDASVAELEQRLLEHADGVTADIVATGATLPVRIRPAKAIWGRLIQQIEAIGLLDRDRVFDGDGSKLRTLEGRVKLAKLDFLLRYPQYLVRILQSRGVDEPIIVSIISEETPLHERMIRYRYGPWDPSYYAVLGSLIGRGLVDAVPIRRGIGYRTTNLGRHVVHQILSDDVWASVDQHAKLARRHLDLAGKTLKDLLYEAIPEMTNADWYEELR